MSTLGADSFDQWLGQQLQQHASAVTGPSPVPAQAQYHVKGALHMPFLAKVAAVLSTKAAIGVTASILAVSAAGAGEAVITGSVNPSDWGKQVVQQVNTCKDALAPGSHGIGQCVSSFASQHGKKGNSEKKANPAATPGQGPNQSPGPNHTPGPPANKKVHPTPPGKARPAPSNNSMK